MNPISEIYKICLMTIEKMLLKTLITSLFLNLTFQVNTQSTDQTRRDNFQKIIDEYTAARENGEHGDPDVLFVGSSSFRLYIGFDEDFAGLNAVNLGFGGSQLSDVLYFFDELIEPYDPKQIIVYEGDNDLYAGLTVEEFMADVRAFVRLVQIRKPGTHISFLAPKPSPARRDMLDIWKASHQAIYEYANNTPGVDYIDIAQPMYDLDGQLKTEIWKSDSLHMNRAGYEIWAPIIRSFIRVQD